MGPFFVFISIAVISIYFCVGIKSKYALFPLTSSALKSIN